MVLLKLKDKIKILDKKGGFTLIELLVVISIIGILAYIVMADYNSEIKRSRVRVAAESLYSELQDLEVMVSSGSYDSATSQMYCWGLFLDDSGIEEVYTVYDDGCDYSNVTTAGSVDLGADTYVTFSYGFAGGYLFFVPPYADIALLDESFYEVQNLDELSLSLNGDVSSKFVVIDLLNGNYSIADEITE